MLVICFSCFTNLNYNGDIKVSFLRKPTRKNNIKAIYRLFKNYCF